MKLFVADDSTKFIQNIKLSASTDINIISTHHTGQLYRLHQRYKLSAYLFSLQHLNKEVLQFINDYHSSVKIFIYHYQKNVNIIEKLPKCYHMIHKEQDNINVNNIIPIPKLLNTNIFVKTNHSKIYNQHIVCFMDQIYDITPELNLLLYPNSKLKIKMYNTTTKHPQNLGLASEQDKFHILNNNQYYLSLDGLYDQEAMLCNCDILTINNLKERINDSIDMSYESYSQFLIDTLI